MLETLDHTIRIASIAYAAHYVYFNDIEAKSVAKSVNIPMLIYCFIP